MSNLAFGKLNKSGIPYDAYRLATAIVSRMAPGSGLCHATNRELAEELEISENRVSKMKAHLVNVKFLYKANPRLVIVNPTWFFNGSPEQQHTAIESWCRLHPIGVAEKEVA